MGVSVCMLSSPHSPVDSKLLMRVYISRALLEVREKSAPQGVCVFVHTIKRGYEYVFVCMCACLPASLHSPVDSYLCTYVRICMYVCEHR